MGCDIVNSSTIKGDLDEFLPQLITVIKLQSSPNDLLGPELWEYTLQKFRNLFFKSEDKTQFLDFITTYLDVNYKGLQNVGSKIKAQNQYGFCGNAGQELHKILKRISFSNETNYQIIKFLVHSDILQKTTNQVAQRVSKLYEKNPDSFAILSLYLLIKIQKQLQSKNYQQVEKEFKETIIDLSKKYPPSSINQDFSEQTKVFDSFIKDEFQKDEIHFKNSIKSKLEQIKDFILKKVEGAQKDYEIFTQLIKKRCYKHGYGLKTGLKIKKIKGHYNNSAIQRTIQKMTQKFRKQQNKTEKNFQKNIKQILKQYFGVKNPQKDFLKFIEAQKHQVSLLTEKILKQQETIDFDVKDLIRGKSIFENIEELVETAQQLIDHIRQSGHRVVDLKNRFKQNGNGKATNDLVLIIKLPNSIAELQLALKLDSYANQFNHKLYELQRSSTFSLMANLNILNQQWCEKLFNQLTQFLDFLDKVKQKPDAKITKQQFQSLNSSYRDFLDRFLLKNKISWMKSQQQKETQIKQIQKEANKIIEILKGGEFQNFIDKQQRSIEMKKNEIYFLYNFMDYSKALQFFSNITPSQNSNYAKILNVIGLVYQNQGDYVQALKSYDKSLNIQIKIKGQISADVASIYNNIGIVYCDQGNYPQALKNYKKCLQIQKRVNGQFSIEVATTYNNIGVVCKQQGKYSEALKNYNKCLEIQTKIKGEQSIEVATTLSNIGIIYRNQTNYVEALKKYNKSLEIITKIKGELSSDVAITLENIGIVYENQGNYTQALKSYNKSLEIETKIKGESSIDVANILFNLSLFYEKTYKLWNSLNCCKKSYNIRKNILGQGHFLTIEVANQLKEVQKAIGQNNK